MFTLLDGFGNDLSKGDKNIIEILNKNPESFIGITIKDFSNKVNSATPTISKFVRKMGFKNYRNFQTYISKKYHIKKEMNFFKPLIEDEKNSITLKNYDFYSIDETVRKLDVEKLELFIKSIVNSKKVWCIGMGNSYMAAQDLSNSLNSQGIISFNTNDIYGEIGRLKLINNEDLIIFISERFQQDEYKKLIKFANTKKTKIAVITATNEFFIDEKIDYIINFFAFPRNKRPDIVRNVKIQQIFVNNIIISMLIKAKGEDLTKKHKLIW